MEQENKKMSKQDNQIFGKSISAIEKEIVKLKVRRDELGKWIYFHPKRNIVDETQEYVESREVLIKLQTQLTLLKEKSKQVQGIIDNKIIEDRRRGFLVVRLEELKNELEKA